MDVRVNRPFMSLWEEKYYLWREQLTETDVTKSGYLRCPTRQELIDMISRCWIKVDVNTIQNSFIK